MTRTLPEALIDAVTFRGGPHSRPSLLGRMSISTDDSPPRPGAQNRALMRRNEKTERRRFGGGQTVGKVEACLVAARVVVNASKVAPSEVRATLPVPLRPALGVRRECWQSRVIPNETDRRPGSPWKSVDPRLQGQRIATMPRSNRERARTVVFGAAEGDALRPTVVAAEESGFCHRDQRLRVRDGE